MSSDGAHLGVKADRAMQTIVGGDPEPAEEERMTAAQMAEWIRGAVPESAAGPGWDYGECARYAAKLVLDWLFADPTRATGPVESVWRTGPDGKTDWSNPVIEQPGWYERMKADRVPIDDLGLSGFQWGWAANAARRCLELPPVPNPAIVTIDDES